GRGRLRARRPRRLPGQCRRRGRALLARRARRRHRHGVGIGTRPAGLAHRSRARSRWRAGTAGLAVTDSEDFTLANLPYGVAGGRAYVATGDQGLDLLSAGFGDDFDGPLNRFLARGPAVWNDVRRRVTALLRDEDAARPHLVDRASLAMELPVEI